MKRVMRGLAVSVGSLACCLAIAEAGLRLWNPLDLDWRLAVNDPARGAALAPNFDGSFRGTRVKTNQFGHRIPTRWPKGYEAGKPAGATRVLVLGDSFTFGDEWPAEASFVEQLQQRVDPSFTRIQVLNLGVFGYGPLQEWLYLRDAALAFEPDAVIVQFTDANDLIPFVPDSPKTWLRRCSYLDWFVADLWFHGRGSAIGRALRRQSWPARPETGLLDELQASAAMYYRSRQAAIKHEAPGWRQAYESYRAMGGLLAERRIPLVIMTVPPNWDLACAAWDCRDVHIPYEQTVRSGRRFHQLLAEKLGEFAAAYVSLDDVFGPYTLQELYDGNTWHYGPTKASIIAAHLVPVLARCGIVTEPGKMASLRRPQHPRQGAP